MRVALFALILLQPALAEDKTIPLYQTLGNFGRKITTSDPMAQRYFDQGLRLAYAFGREAAARSFREAYGWDQDCAMCYWGEAWAMGPYQNEKMSEENAQEAYPAIQKALSLSEPLNDVEKALIEAMLVRYRKEPDPENRRELDEAYVRAMEDVVRRFPWDLDAGTLYAESLIVLHPWDLRTAEGEDRPETVLAIDALESVLGRNLKHPGACHLYIHAVESSSTPARAEACADLLADVMPGASHIQHMPSHIYMRVGRYGDAVRANQRAVIADQMAARGRAVAIYSDHNLQMLAFAATWDGQSSIAMQAASDHVRQGSDPVYLTQVLTRFGRWEELLALEPPEGTFPLAIWHFGRALAHLRSDDLEAARESLKVVASSREDVDPESEYRRNKAQDLLTIAESILNGEILRVEGHHNDAMRAFRKGLASEDGLSYSEPEPWLLPIRHFMGAALFEAGRNWEAEKLYREDLETHPQNGWALLGLDQSLRAQGKEFEADAAGREFERAWARADVWLPGSRF